MQQSQQSKSKVSFNKLSQRVIVTISILVLFVFAQTTLYESTDDEIIGDILSLLDSTTSSSSSGGGMSDGFSQNDDINVDETFIHGRRSSSSSSRSRSSRISTDDNKIEFNDEMMDIMDMIDIPKNKVVLRKGERRPNSGLYSPAPNNTHLILEPSFGQHRPNVDAIFGMAEGYHVRQYLIFIESLRKTGFEGDVVLSVTGTEKLNKGVEDYLRSYQVEEDEDGEGLNIVVYSIKRDCYNGRGVKVSGAAGGQNMCELVGMYGNDIGTPIKDPRDRRPVAIARYELYWAWSQYYNNDNWIMLSDTRDVYFQSNPFVTLHKETSVDVDVDGGMLYFYAEPFDIEKSPINMKWLENAYGKNNVTHFYKRKILCSGSTIGQVAALEPYLHAMIHEYDKTKASRIGSDQAFHNYLYYTDALSNLKGIKETVVYEQGKGIVNNIGMFRSKPFREWGILNEQNEVLNWDGSISAVVHQYDRDKELNNHIIEIRDGYERNFWASSNPIADGKSSKS